MTICRVSNSDHNNNNIILDTYLCTLGLLGMREHVRLEISGLSKSLVAVVKRTDIWPVPSVDTDVGTEVEVQGEPLTTAFKCTL